MHHVVEAFAEIHHSPGRCLWDSTAVNNCLTYGFARQGNHRNCLSSLSSS